MRRQGNLPGENIALNPLEFQYMKAYTRWRLGLRSSRPTGTNEALSYQRRLQIEKAVEHMLRP